MTILMTVQSGADLTRVRRYEGSARGKLFCTHEGFYEPATVDVRSVLVYQDHPPHHDRRGWRTGCDASCDHYGKQPA